MLKKLSDIAYKNTLKSMQTFDNKVMEAKNTNTMFK